MSEYVYVIVDTTRDKAVKYYHRPNEVSKFIDLHCNFRGDNTEDYMIRIYGLDGNIKYITADDWLKGKR